MLTRLIISNYALISRLDISFGPGFSVITGETGAGKSIILGALGLLLGDRADSKNVKPSCDRCVIEGHFDVSSYGIDDFFGRNDLDNDPTDCIMRRELNASGKSRAFINDTPVPLAVMRELGDSLVDIHSQHQNLLLKKEDFQLGVIDIMANDKPLLDAYKKSWQEYRSLDARVESLRESIKKSRENEDYLRYRLEELDEARLMGDEQESLEQESEMLTHAEEIKSVLYEADEIFSADGGILQLIRTVGQKVKSAGDYLPGMEDAAQRIDSCLIELKDISGDIASEADRLEVDPKRLEKVNDRLDTLYGLQQKYHADSVAQLIAIREDIRRQLDKIDNSDSELEQAQAERDRVLALCNEQAAALSKSRHASSQGIESQMMSRLAPLGIPNARFEVRLSPKPLSADGTDKASFYFSANKSMPPQPITQVASGGEIARVMLSLKALISSAVKLPTIIFDEIDTGVSGKTAEMMARIMDEMGKEGRQVISITHLPQIAALGCAHYKVYKQDTETATESHMKQLSAEERVIEVAQMLSGSDVTEAAMHNAQTLLSRQ